MFDLINKVKEVNPLIVHYTNEVTINDCANVTLAIGASPFMGYSYEEVEEVVAISNAIVINIGTMNSNKLDLFIKAGKVANKLNKPIVLDPVGVFATKARSEFTQKLLNEVKVDVIKGNISEVKFLGGFNIKGKGVDSFDGDEDISNIIKNVATRLNCVIVATGKNDYISDGKDLIKIENGTTKLRNITGSGCMTASLIASFLGAVDNKLKGAAMGTLAMSLAGELADKNNPSIGTFKVKLMDEIYTLDEKKFTEYAKVVENYAI